MKISTKCLCALVVVLMVSACATKKSKEDLGAIGKLYHNTTSKFNGYFHANELYKESLIILEDANQDNYAQVLNVYEYGNQENSSLVAENMDDAIRKVSIVVNLHRGKTVWEDDCYLLLGKAQVLKQEYESAEETMEYLVNEYSPEKMAEREANAKKRKKKKQAQKKSKKEKEKNVKRRKKEREKARKKARKRNKKKNKKKKSDDKKEKVDIPAVKKKRKKKDEDLVPSALAQQNKDGFLAHKPAFQEGLLWLARVYVERERFADADYTMSRLMSLPEMYPEVERELDALKAHYQLRQENYNLAIQPLEQAIEKADKRRKKARYAFIIAQIHQSNGQHGAALAAYDRVLKFGAPYEMEFRARLNRVLGEYESNIVTREAALKRLERMSKDEKNLEYQDQIYYVMAEISLEADNIDEAITNLNKALASSTGNQAQQIEIYYKLATLHLSQEDYINAKVNYDATLQIMPKTDERYSEVNRYSNNLTEIASNLEIIELQDSLLTLSSLSEKELKDIAENIQNERNAEKLVSEATGKETNPANKFQSARASSISRGGRVSPGVASAGAQPSTFFAYNTKSLRRGKREFERKWGDRTLSDDWRRSNRTTFDDAAIVDNSGEVSEGIILTDNEIDAILKDVPKNKAQIRAAEKKLEDAMFMVGTLFRNVLDNNEKCIEYLDALLDRFPDTQHKLEAYYYLYLAHADIQKKTESEAFANKIIEEFPESKYAKSITDPNWLKKNKEDAEALMAAYDKAYFAYESADYQQAFDQIIEANRTFGEENPLQAKFALLNSIVIGNLQGKEAYVTSLKDVIAKFPSSEEERRAKEILRLLGEDVGRGLNASTTASIAADGLVYTSDQMQMHYLIIPLSTSDVDLNKAKISVSNYNLKYHKLKRLRIANVFLGRDVNKPMIVVRAFKNGEEAMKYYKEVNGKKAEYIPELSSFDVYVISRKNYRQLMRDTGIDKYRDFFNQDYLQ